MLCFYNFYTMFSEQLIIIMKKIYTAALVICSLGLAKSQVYETIDMGFMKTYLTMA